jgi:hypothetical protein
MGVGGITPQAQHNKIFFAPLFFKKAAACLTINRRVL